jgi:hypothetical protein
MTPSKRRRMGREDFGPDCNPDDFNPYLNERKKEWFADVHAKDWNDGWMEAQAAYDAEQEEKEREKWVMGRWVDEGCEEQIGEVHYDSSNPPDELEIDGVTWKPEC